VRPTAAFTAPSEVSGSSSCSFANIHPFFELPDLVLAAEWSGDGSVPSSTPRCDSGGGGAVGRSGGSGSRDQLVRPAVGRTQAAKKGGKFGYGGDGASKPNRAGSQESSTWRGWLIGPSAAVVRSRPSDPRYAGERCGGGGV
jgi:hypothetical protein